MSRVLHRAVALLDRLAEGAPATTGELAARAGLPAATCARLLADMRDLGLADQDGPRAPWRLGPLVHAWAGRNPYRDALAERLAPAMRRLARRHRCGVVLAALRGRRRVTLLHVPLPGRPAARPYHESDDIWTTAGGRLLVAWLPPARRRRLIDEIGPPGPAWPEVADRRELDGELRRIRREGRCAWRGPTARSIALPLRRDGVATASLGAYAPSAMPAAAWTAAQRDLADLIAETTA